LWNNYQSFLWTQEYIRLLPVVKKYGTSGSNRMPKIIGDAIRNGVDNEKRREFLQAVKEAKIKNSKIRGKASKERKAHEKMPVLSYLGIQPRDMTADLVGLPPANATLIKRLQPNVLKIFQTPNPWANNNCTLIASYDLGYIGEEKKYFEKCIGNTCGTSFNLIRTIYNDVLSENYPDFELRIIQISPADIFNVLDANLNDGEVTMISYSRNLSGHTIICYKDGGQIFFLDRAHSSVGLYQTPGLTFSQFQATDFANTNQQIISYTLYFMVPKVPWNPVHPSAFSPKRKVRKSPKKSVRKSPKKSVRKSPKKSVRKSPKKSVRKSPKKSVRKSPPRIRR
jgi:hypothetical protein